MPPRPSQTLLLEKAPRVADILICDGVIKILTSTKSCKIDKRECIVNRSLKALNRWFVYDEVWGEPTNDRQMAQVLRTDWESCGK